jgi:hypothetical protein
MLLHVAARVGLTFVWEEEFSNVHLAKRSRAVTPPLTVLEGPPLPLPPNRQILPTTARWSCPSPAPAGRRRLAAAMGSDRAELARLCSARNWSKAIRLLDSILARSPSSIHDLWYVAFSPPRSARSLRSTLSACLTRTPPNSVAATGPSATPSSSSTSTSSRIATAHCCSTPPCCRPTSSKVRFGYNCSPVHHSLFCSLV